MDKTAHSYTEIHPAHNAYLIDPVAKTVEAVAVDLSDYREIYKAIGADCFDVVGIKLMASSDGQPLGLVQCSAFVDDEGALKSDHVCFEIGHRPEVAILLAGKALITGGPDAEGDTLPVHSLLTLDDMRRQVAWTESQITPGFVIRDMATGKLL
jgi:hypothetical protein